LEKARRGKETLVRLRKRIRVRTEKELGIGS